MCLYVQRLQTVTENPQEKSQPWKMEFKLRLWYFPTPPHQYRSCAYHGHVLNTLSVNVYRLFYLLVFIFVNF